MLRSTYASAIAIFFVATVLLPVSVFADDGDDLRRAGSEAQFRIIDRFPDQERSVVELPTVEEDNPFYPVVEQVIAQNWASAHRLLRNEELQNALSERPAKRFLAGYVAHKYERFDEALEHFDALDGELPELSDYRAYFSAQAALELGDPHRATLEAASVASDSRLYGDALYLLGKALEEAGEPEDRERAVEVLQLYLSRYGSRNDAPKVSLMLGEIFEELDRKNDAANTYLDLRDSQPLRSEADTAKERLQALADDVSDRLQRRIEEESSLGTMQRYRGLYELHRNQQVVDELPGRIDDFDDGSDDQCEALFLVAHSHTKLRQHGDGTPWYDRVIDECSDTSFHIRALYLGGRGRWNVSDRIGAMEIFELIWEEYPDHAFADDAMYFTGRILRSEDRHDEAKEVLERQVETYPDGDMAKDAHWLLVRRLFDDDDFEGIVEYVDGLESTGEDDLYTRGRLHYFRARALEFDGQNDRAEEAFTAVARDYPKTFYALLALNRLGRLAGAEGDDLCAAIGDVCDDLLISGRAAESIEVPNRLRRDDAFKRGALLLSIGLSADARAEFSRLRNRHSGHASTLWALAMLLDRAGAHPISHDIARRHIDGWMNEYPTRATRARWEVAYPTPFKDLVIQYARDRDVDAAMIFAIMREESGFNPRIDSWANARGLLQLIEGTADRMAQRVDLSPYTFARLHEPEVNINLGSAYMDYLGERLDEHPALIMAAYNGGSGVVTSWLDEFGDLPLDLWVEDVPYGQTRKYVKRVMMSYWIYSYLYGDDRVPRVAFELP